MQEVKMRDRYEEWKDLLVENVERFGEALKVVLKRRYIFFIFHGVSLYTLS